ncbi:MAG TPA: hypothetical protein VHQ70_09340 [Syntrophomonadaceae bacterium]|nr:hypothetical protein [Syntrophomonadaceae bacterium]
MADIFQESVKGFLAVIYYIEGEFDTMWRINNEEKREFCGGREDWQTAARIAENCPGFKADDEDEMVADEDVSCYNCRFRRWTEKSFVCCRQD